MKLFTFLLVLTIFLTPVASKALPTNFGGQFAGYIPCTCSANFLVFIRDVRYQYLPVVYQPGFTFMHKMYSPVISYNTVGNFIPGAGICLVYIGTGCGVVPSVGMMLNFGTNAAPFAATAVAP